MTLNPTFFRHIPKLDDPKMDLAVRIAFEGIKDLSDAVVAVHDRTTTAETNITNITQRVDSGTSSGGTTLPVNVNQQVADYALQNSDFGGLVVFTGVGPYTATLNPSVSRPWYSSILNLSAADLTVLPGDASGTATVINAVLTSVTIPSGYWGVVFFDGLNWWMLLLPTAAASTPVIGEIPVGAVDGVNVTYTLAHSPTAGTSQLYADGLRYLDGTMYSISGSTLTYVTPLTIGSNHVIDYSF